jgi:predicted aspartyl protease
VTPILAAILMGARLPAVDISLPFTSPKGLIVVQAEGNGGKPLRMLIDTGAQRTVVDRTVAESLGLEKGEDVRARGSGGSVDAWWAKGLHLQGLGEAPLEAVVLPLDGIGKAIGTPIDVILGQDVIGKRVIEIDRTAGKVTFGTRPAIVSSAATVVSLVLRGGRPYLRATVVGPTGRETPADLLLDTGSDTAAELAQPYADEVGLPTKPDPNGRSIMGVGGIVPLRVADLREIRVGRVTVPSQDVRVFHRPADSAGDGDGRVGNGFLSNYKVTIDGPGLKLILTPVRKEPS